MAVRDHQQAWVQSGVSRTVWSGLLNTDTGSPQKDAALPDRSVQVGGTFGAGGSVALKGSNDGVTYFTLTDPQGNALVFTANAIEQVQENTLFTRPEVLAGDGTTNLTVTLISRG